MKKHWLILSLLCFRFFAYGQQMDQSLIQLNADTIIHTGIYTSYYSYTLKEPLYVIYTLSKGGGECDRTAEHFHFTACGCENAATGKDYAHTGYDEGHLVNAEDFAFDCEKEKQTFCFYNCLPQTAKLNRGIWKQWETKIRNQSQTEALEIITGGIYGTKTIGENKIGVPDYCFKVVMDAGTHEVIWCLLFPNDESNNVEQIAYDELKVRLGYVVAEEN